MSVWLGLLLGRQDERRGRAPGCGAEARGPGKIIFIYLFCYLLFFYFCLGIWPRLDQQQDPQRAHDC